MLDQDVIKEIERMMQQNPQYQRLGCLYDNRYRKKCPTCVGARDGCKAMLEAFRYPPYNI